MTVLRMPEHRMPQQILYGEICEGERNRERQKLRCKDNLKQNLKKAILTPKRGENMQMIVPSEELPSTGRRVLLKKGDSLSTNEHMKEDIANQR